MIAPERSQGHAALETGPTFRDHALPDCNRTAATALLKAS